MKELEAELTAEQDLDEESMQDIERVKTQVVDKLKEDADAFKMHLSQFVKETKENKGAEHGDNTEGEEEEGGQRKRSQ